MNQRVFVTTSNKVIRRGKKNWQRGSRWTEKRRVAQIGSRKMGKRKRERERERESNNCVFKEF